MVEDYVLREMTDWTKLDIEVNAVFFLSKLSSTVQGL